MKRKITKNNKVQARDLIDQIPSIAGAVRVVYKCADCGQLFGRRFIPFGFGYGLSVNTCLCQITGRRVSYEVLRSED